MVPVFEAKENPVAGNDGALIKESSTGSEAISNDSQYHVAVPDPASTEDEADDFNSFASRLTPLHEVAYLTIEKVMASADFADEMEETARLGRSVHRQAGLRLYDEVIHGINKENVRRKSREIKEHFVLKAGWVKVPGGYLPHKGSRREPLPLYKALSEAGVDIPMLLPIPKLGEGMTVQILMNLETVIKVDLTGLGEEDKAPLAVYDKPSGLYVTDEVKIEGLLTLINPGFSGRQADAAMARLRALAPLRKKSRSARYIPVNNGIFDHEKKELLDYSPEFVFLTKSPVDFDPHAENIPIMQPDGTPWDVESFIVELGTTVDGEIQEGVPELLWEILSAVVRPGVRYNKAVFLHSTKGNNGKGTLCQLARNLKGDRGHASIPISRFEKPFALTPLMHADAVITDENPVGAFAKELDVFKSVVTGDTFTLERKHKDPYNARFEGVMIQCVNDFPTTRDKSASLARRQLFVPFRNWFGGDGVERKYIKDDYLARPEVLRYVLRRCLEMDHTQFSNPSACQELMEAFQRENDHVRDFWFEFSDRYVWDLLPLAFLYSHFKAWFAANAPSGSVIGRNEFKTRLSEAVDADPSWNFKEGPIHTGSKMDAPEHLIEEFQLEEWMNPKGKSSTDLNKKCSPVKSKNYRHGLVRV